jgi:hypothetical protein
MRRLAFLLVLLIGVLWGPAVASANTSHAGWPHIDGMLLMNKLDQPRPLDGRPGRDPFGGTDPSYSCDGLHLSTDCIRGSGGEPFVSLLDGFAADLCDEAGLQDVCDEVDDTNTPGANNLVPDDIGHNELLGGHGSDTITAGPRGDVIWGDYKPSGQPASQRDYLTGGAGRDFIYASHGTNVVSTGRGRDVVHAHFGHGSITCGSKLALVYLSHVSIKRYRLHGCRRISFKTLGY